MPTRRALAGLLGRLAELSKDEPGSQRKDFPVEELWEWARAALEPRRGAQGPAPPRDNNGDGRILLYYKYVALQEAELQDVRQWQVDLCSLLHLRGRIHIGVEGINGTVGGCGAATRLYQLAMRTHPRWSGLFGDIDFKASRGASDGRRCFPNLFVKVVKEIIMLQRGAASSQSQWQDRARHLKPLEFHRRLVEAREKKEDVVVLDVRNMYESAVGQFDRAVRLNTRHFTEFPQEADRLVSELDLRNKSAVFMYCTGGIRCERASAYLKSKGVRNCYQLRGGIHRYCEAVGDDSSLFRGRNFVFDRRLLTDRVGKVPVGHCSVCRAPWDDYDTRWVCGSCNALVLLCTSCREYRDRGGVKKRKNSGPTPSKAEHSKAEEIKEEAGDLGQLGHEQEKNPKQQQQQQKQGDVHMKNARKRRCEPEHSSGAPLLCERCISQDSAATP